MKRIVEMPLGDGSDTKIFIEENVDEYEDFIITKKEEGYTKKGGMVPASASGGKDGIGKMVKSLLKTEKIDIPLKKAIENIKPTVKLVTDTLKDINEPSEIAVEFGINIKGGIGIIAQTEVASNFKVSMKWVNKKNLEVKQVDGK